MPIDRVVITVPASFQLTQRKDTIKAAELAGIELKGQDLMAEPVAAFLDFLTWSKGEALSAKKVNRVMVVDFGGGTCDVALLQLTKSDVGNLEVASKGVSRLKDPMPVIITINTWRACMEYFVLDRMDDCIDALKNSNKNCSGVMLDVLNWFHDDVSFEKSLSIYLWAIFPGNFFWVKGSWFAEQNEPTFEEDRYEYERFLGTCDGTNPYYIWIKKYSEVGAHMSYFEPIYEHEYKKEYREEEKLI
jgi:hypothetical protein